MLRVYDLSINGVKNPAFVLCSNLYLGWKLDSDHTGVKQSSYRLTVLHKGEEVFNSGIVASDRSVHVQLAFTLKTRSDYSLTVTICDNYGESAAATISFGTEIAPEEWVAKWIKPKKHIESWAPYLRTKFEAKGSVVKAKLYICALGCGEYYINGKRISEDLIDPPFTNYEKEKLYRIYDVTSYIEKRNAIAVLLGDGWYSQSRVWSLYRGKYGDVTLLAQLELEYEGGEKEIIATDTENWRYKYSPVVQNNLYGGETYDCRLETPDFALADGDDDEWGEVIEDTNHNEWLDKGAIPEEWKRFRICNSSEPMDKLHLCQMPPIRIVRSLPVKKVRPLSGKNAGAWIVDFGENISGFVEIRIPRAPRGAQYVLRFAETINPDGSLDYRSIGTFATHCIQQDIYIARGDEEGEIWRPRFTYHGFRYMEITGFYPGKGSGADPVPEESIAICHVISTDLASAGDFKSSCKDLNSFMTLFNSTFRSNYHGFPEDCPAREKCAWGGDAQLVSNLAIMSYDMEASYNKFVYDLQTDDEVYDICQMVAIGRRGCGNATPLWGCANIVIPYWMYHYYGNESIVRQHWHIMEKWFHYDFRDAQENTPSGYTITRGLGDWCPPGGNGASNIRRLPVTESSTAMLYENACMMAELSEALKLPASFNYREIAAKTKAAFIDSFWDKEKHGYSTWGGCGVALKLGLYPDGEREALITHLATMMANDDYAMPTGIYANKYLVPALAENGLADNVLRFLFNRNHPSFATMMDDGATSLWEEVEMKNIGHPRDKAVSSFNHPMQAAFAYFIYSHLAGIKPLKPGFREFEISPIPFNDIPSAEIEHISPYGKISVSFRREGDRITYQLQVPPNTTAHFHFGDLNQGLGSGSHKIVVEV